MDYLPTEAPDNGFLADFLSRPVLVYSTVWTSAAPVNTHFDPWALFLNDAAVSNKINNFARLRGTLHIELQINGTPFHYGAVLASYEPANGLRRSIDGDYRQHSNLSHGFLNPTNSQSVKLVAPFMHPKNWIELTSTSGAEIGVVNLDTVINLLSASTTIEPVTITAYAWMEDVQLAFPTNQVKATFVAQAKKVTVKKRKGGQVGKDEYTENPNQGLISTPANALANIAGRLSDVPVIGKWATATQIGATAVANVASLFGWSRPMSLQAPAHYLALPSSSLATTDSAVNTMALTVGSKSEITVDPCAIGYNTNEDELALANIVRKPTLMAVSSISVSAAAGTNIITNQVQPMSLTSNNSGVGVDMGVLNLSALAFGTAPFKYWAGTIVYRFQIVCSKYHRGRLRIQYSPDPAAIFSTALNTTYNHIVDIAPGKEFEVVIPYASQQPALEVPTLGDSSSSTSNGSLRVSIQNEISAPDSTSAIYLLTWIYAGDDYKVFVPTEEQFQFAALDPQSAHDENDGVTTYESVQFFNASLGDAYDLTIMGDPVTSFRPLLKRYTLHTSVINDPGDPSTMGTSTCANINFKFPMYPQRCGPTTYGTSIGNATYLQGNVNFNHLANWLEPSFLAKRGSFRWIVDPGMPAQSNVATLKTSLTAERIERDDIRQIWEQERQVVSTSYRWATSTEILTNMNVANGFKGSQIFIADNEGGHLPEFSAPFYWPYRYCLHFGSEASTYYPRSQCKVSALTKNIGSAAATVGNSSFWRFYCAAGEDFSLNVFLGVPLWRYSSTINPWLLGSEYEVGTIRSSVPLP